jgi:hypothetical protein
MNDNSLPSLTVGMPTVRRRRTVLVVAASCAVLATSLLWLGGGDPGTQLVSREACPADLGDCSGLPDTTVSDPTIPTTLATTTTVPSPPSTVSVDAKVLTATSKTLALEVSVEPAQLLTGELLTVHVRAEDSPGSVIVGASDFGDGRGGARARPPILECKPSDQRPATLAPAERTLTLPYSYRLPGAYKLRVDVISSRCSPDKAEQAEDGDLTATVEAVISVGKGVPTGNGPVEPLIDLTQRTDFDNPGAVIVDFGTKDPDGLIDRVSLDWGDNTQDFETRRSRNSCVDPVRFWPTSELIDGPSHRYPAPGRYTARLTVYSTACDGSAIQTSTRTIEVNAP